MTAITITKVEIYTFSIPMDPFTISLGTINAAQNILVKIYTDNGLYGWGEASPFWMLVGETQAASFVIAQDFARLWLGKNPLDIESRMAELHHYLAFNPTIKGAFDMALYDIAGKNAGLPLYALLGGGKRVLTTDETIGLGRAETMAAKAILLKEKGAPAIKVKLGAGLEEDIHRIKTIRSAIGEGIPLRIDANQGWNVVTALGVLNAVAGYNIQYCEEPVKRWNNRDLKRIKDHSPIPIMADESVFDHHDAFKLASMEACDYINIKLAKSGGIYNALKINSVAEAAGIHCMMGSMCESRLGLTASAHFASAKQNILYCDLDMVFTMHADPVIGGIEYKGYDIHLPDTPGIGADIDPEFLKDAAMIVVSTGIASK
jgi:L-Ala-D/L-Glu epimerase